MSEPKRKKPWYRIRNILLTILAVIVLLSSYVFVETWRVYKAEPKISRDYRLEFREISAQEAGIHASSGGVAWELLVDAAGRYTQTVKDYEQRIRDGDVQGRKDVNGDPVPVVDFSLLQLGRELPAEIDPERGALSLLRKRDVFYLLAGFVRAGPGIRSSDSNEPMLFEMFPEVGECRQLSKCRAASMRLSMIEGNVVDVCDAFEEILAIGHTTALQPGILFHLVGQAIQATAMQELARLLDEFDFDEPAAKRMMSSLDEYRLPDGVFMFEGERTLFHDFAQSYYVDVGGEGYMNMRSLNKVASAAGDVSPEAGSFLGAFLGRFFLVPRSKTIAAYDDFIKKCQAEARLPRINRWKSFDPSAIDLKSWGYQHAVLAIMLPAVHKAADQARRTEQLRAATRLMLAIEIHQRQTGGIPDSLAALPYGLLPNGATDPMHGKPFGYRVLKSDPSGRQFLLYSTGLDETDNGAVEPAGAGDRDDAISSKAAHGFDYVFNKPREEPEAGTD